MEAEALLKALPLVRPQISDFRKEFYRAIVLSTALALPDAEKDGFDTSKLLDAIRLRFRLDSFPSFIVVDALEDLERARVLTRHGTVYSVRSRQALVRPDVIEEVFVEFEETLRAKIADYDRFINRSYHDAFRLAFASLVKVIGASTEPTKLILESVHAAENRNQIVRAIVGVLPNRVEAEKFVDMFVEYVTGDKPLATRYLFSVYQGIIFVDLLSRSTEMASALGKFGAGCRLVLDTNVLVASMCESNPRHGLVISTLQFAKSLGFDPLYARETKSEFNNLLQAANYEMSNPAFSFRAQDIELVTDYLKRGGGISWFERFVELSNFERTLEGLYGAHVQDFPLEEPSPSELQTFEASMQTIIRVAGKPRGREALYHDLSIWETARELRKEARPGPFPEPWFVTLDNILVAFDELQRLQAKAELGYVIHVRTLLAALVPFWNPQLSGADRGSLVSGLVENLVVPVKVAFTLQEYLKLLTQKLGLDPSDAATLLKIVTQSPLKAQLTEGLQEADQEIVSNTTIAILTESQVVEEIVGRGKAEKEVAELRERLSAVAEKYKLTQAELDAYKKLAARPVVVLVQAGLPAGIPELLLGAVERIKAEAPTALASAGVSENDLQSGDLSLVRRFVSKLEEWINRAGTAAQSLQVLLPVLQLVASQIPRI